MTKYCPVIRLLCPEVWGYMSDVFSYKLKVSEIGMTNHLIFDITDFYNGFPGGCEILCHHAKYEKDRGADIDLFIQDSKGKYKHYMIQAKVMDFRGYYTDISKWNPKAQFLTLLKRAKKENALALYLLYNGLTPKSSLGSFNFGTSIIEAEEIRKFRFNQKINGYLHGQNSLSFDMLFAWMQPYYNLFCGGLKNIKLPPDKDESEIYKGYPYQQIRRDGTSREDNTDNKSEENEQNVIVSERSLAPIRIIIKYNPN